MEGHPSHQVNILKMHEYNDNLLKTSWSFLDENLSFWKNINVKIKKATIGVNLLRKLNLYYHVRTC